MQLADGVAVTKDGEATHFVPSTEPDIAGDVDRANGWREPGDNASEVIPTLATAFVQVLNFCWTDHRDNVRDPDAALRRFCAFSMVLKPELFPDESYASMARKLGCTKAAISKLALEFSDLFHVHLRRSRSESSRLKFKLLTEAAWKRRRA